MTTSHFVADLEFAFFGNIHFRHFHNARLQFVAREHFLALNANIVLDERYFLLVARYQSAQKCHFLFVLNALLGGIELGEILRVLVEFLEYFIVLQRRAGTENRFSRFGAHTAHDFFAI